MKVIEDHNLHDQILTQVLGWKWMSYIGKPCRGTEGYPEDCRVRQLMSPRQLESQKWKDYFAGCEGREADGTEPLSYRYCSSVGPAMPPRILILVDE